MKHQKKAMAGLGLLLLCVSVGGQDQAVPKFKYDPTCRSPFPNKWKMGGVTGFGGG